MREWVKGSSGGVSVSWLNCHVMDAAKVCGKRFLVGRKEVEQRAWAAVDGVVVDLTRHEW